jgi:hypothetical protein
MNCHLYKGGGLRLFLSLFTFPESVIELMNMSAPKCSM